MMLGMKEISVASWSRYLWPVILISPLLLVFLFLLISPLLFEEPLRFLPLLAHRFCPDRNFFQFTAGCPAQQSVACEGGHYSRGSQAGQEASACMQSPS